MIVGGLAVLGVAAALVLKAFNENLVFFFTPTQVEAKQVPQGRAFRIGGMVVPDSVKRRADGVTVQFLVTDTAKDVPVVYRGILPDLFKEGKGVVTQGKLGDDGVFYASEVLAKHDENYMPREVVEALKKSGHWQEGGASKAAAGPVAVTPADPRDGPQGPAARGGVQGVAAKPAAPGFPLSRE